MIPPLDAMEASTEKHTIEPSPMKIRRWIRLSPLGYGSFGRVSLAINLDNGSFFAVKSINNLEELPSDSSSPSPSPSQRSSSSPEILAMKVELSILRSLRSPRIISCFGSDGSSNLFLEYMEGGSVAALVKKSGGSLEEWRVRRFTRDIVEGLAYLHSQEIVHCDIKGQNILIGSDSSVKIADFGSAKKQSEHHSRHYHHQERKRKPCSFASAEDLTEEKPVYNSPAMIMRGTPLWMAPEVLQGVEQSFPSDIWSLGCTVVEMLQGCSPWMLLSRSSSPHKINPLSSFESLLFKIACSQDNPPLPHSLSEECRDFLCKCLHRDPNLRWTASQLLEHPFLLNRNSDVSSSLDDASFCSELQVPQPSPRSTLGFLDLSDDESDYEQEDYSMVEYCASFDRSSLAHHNTSSKPVRDIISSPSSFPPPVEIPRVCNWITVRSSAEQLHQRKQQEANGCESYPVTAPDFMRDSSRQLLVKKGCEVNLGCLDFLRQRRV